MKVAMLVIGASITSFASAQLSVSDSGTATFSRAIPVPPGLAGMSPKIGLTYSGGGNNGPVGYGWSIQGISTITRCPANMAIDGIKGKVAFAPSDKLCLDGQRLIQTDVSGTVVNGNVQRPSTTNPFQSGDSLGSAGSGAIREYRTEKDMYARIRAYGYASNDASGASGPAYFKVWTKSGQIFEYGASPSADTNTKALITPYNKTVAAVWAVSRISDTLGNFIDFKYEQRDVAWGSGGTTSVPTLGHEWNLLEIDYSGNKVIFNYTDRTARSPEDRSEAYHQGSKNVSVRLLQSVTTYVNATYGGAMGVPTGAVPVTSVRLTYENGTVSGRSRLTKIQDCSGSADTTSKKCLPATTFTYVAGGSENYFASNRFNLATLVLTNVAGTYGVITGDFNGDGKTDFIRWSNNPAENQLYLSSGDGSFALVPSGQGSGLFNITDQKLWSSDGCYLSSIVDVNGDGLPDLVRYSGQTNSTGNACSASGPTYVYLSNGDGSFTRKDYAGPKLMRYGVFSYGTFQTEQITSLQGENFYFMDFDGDGKVDLVTSSRPFSQQLASSNSVCASAICTRVFRGQGDGTFTEVASTNLTHQLTYVYADNLKRYSPVVDLDGDGLSDLTGIMAFGSDPSSFRSRGDGNFDPASSGMTANECEVPIDFNGDGRADCLAPNASLSLAKLAVATGSDTMPDVPNFNLKATGQELAGAGVGIQIADFNGDGRSDILRWKDDPTKNTVYLSNGDGTFAPSTTFNLTNAAMQLRKSDGSSDFVLGDFTGRGTTEILRLRASPADGAAASNQLFLKSDPTPPDQLFSVTAGSGAVTTVSYVPLSNPFPSGFSGAYGARYKSDRVANSAPGPLIDVTLPLYVVATLFSDNGVNFTKSATEYSYYGLKADTGGRGIVGFREIHRQSLGPDPKSLPISVFTQYLQKHPYIGATTRSDTYRGTIDSLSAPVLSSTLNVYCDLMSAVGAEAAPLSNAAKGFAGQACDTSSKVQRPYLLWSQETGTDISGKSVPTVTTKNTYQASGDPTIVAVTTTGQVGGRSLPTTKTTTNSYLTDVTNGDTWILGRLAVSTVDSSVSDVLGSIGAPSAGTAPNASSIKGTAPLPPRPPLTAAQLMPILQLLLLDD